MTLNLKLLEKRIQDTIGYFSENGWLNREDIIYIKQLLETYRVILEIKALKKDGTQKP